MVNKLLDAHPIMKMQKIFLFYYDPSIVVSFGNFLEEIFIINNLVKLLVLNRLKEQPAKKTNVIFFIGKTEIFCFIHNQICYRCNIRVHANFY